MGNAVLGLLLKIDLVNSEIGHQGRFINWTSYLSLFFFFFSDVPYYGPHHRKALFAMAIFEGFLYTSFVLSFFYIINNTLQTGLKNDSFLHS